MSVTIHKMTTTGYGQSVDPDQQPVALADFGGAIDLGGGLFLTAAHIFYTEKSSTSYISSEFLYKAVS